MKWMEVILYTLVTIALFMIIPYVIDLISPCRTTSTEEADFFLLPTFNDRPDEFKAVVKAVEATHNITLHRRGMRDHIYPGLWNAADSCNDEDWSDTAKAVYRMLKVLGEIYTWNFSFSSRQGPHCNKLNLENMIAMPYVSDPHNLSGDIHRPRKYLSLFMGNNEYPWYRMTIAEQCDNAIDCYYPNKSRDELLEQQRYDMYINSTFFFCPAGDTPTRELPDKHSF
jgi:hypothetical protein